MNNPAHTAGEWEWSTGDPDMRIPRVYSRSGGPIADVVSKSHADARLIKAAPGMRALIAEQAAVSCECADIPGACNPCRSRVLIAEIDATAPGCCPECGQRLIVIADTWRCPDRHREPEGWRERYTRAEITGIKEGR